MAARLLCGMLAVAALACCGSAPVIDDRPVPVGVPTVVLVHGSWHTAKTWTRVTAHLDAQNVKWVAVELPSTNPTPAFFLPGLAEDVEATTAAIAAIDGPVVLVGHSYGGMVISAQALTIGSRSSSTFAPTCRFRAKV